MSNQALKPAITAEFDQVNPYTVQSGFWQHQIMFEGNELLTFPSLMEAKKVAGWLNGAYNLGFNQAHILMEFREET